MSDVNEVNFKTDDDRRFGVLAYGVRVKRTMP
jgi:hypothetical protein